MNDMSSQKRTVYSLFIPVRMDEKIFKNVHEIMKPILTAVKNKQNDIHLAKSYH